MKKIYYVERILNIGRKRGQRNRTFHTAHFGLWSFGAKCPPQRVTYDFVEENVGLTARAFRLARGNIFVFSLSLLMLLFVHQQAHI